MINQHSVFLSFSIAFVCGFVINLKKKHTTYQHTLVLVWPAPAADITLQQPWTDPRVPVVAR